jgi:hypothetical protein
MFALDIGNNVGAEAVGNRLNLENEFSDGHMVLT